MEDHKIIDLYWARSQQAIVESDQKYGPYCRAIRPWDTGHAGGR